VEEGPKARRVLVLLVAGEAIAVVALHRLGGVDGFALPRHDLGRWLQQSTSEEVLLAGVRLVALVAAWWLLGSTVLYVAARVARLHGAARAFGWATLPAVRRWVDRAAAVSIVAATALGVGRRGSAAHDEPGARAGGRRRRSPRSGEGSLASAAERPHRAGRRSAARTDRAHVGNHFPPTATDRAARAAHRAATRRHGPPGRAARSASSRARADGGRDAHGDEGRAPLVDRSGAGRQLERETAGGSLPG
jgi:hypothetical protein